jgi:hypothetical protein
MNESLALGFRAHSGWAVAVAVTESRGIPKVLERRRIVIADAAIPGSKQPFHAAEKLDFREAEALLGRCRKRSEAMAAGEIGILAAALRESHRMVGSGLLMASGRALPDLEAILRSHALIHTAEGEFFRDVLAGASERCGLPVKRVKEREAWERGAEALDMKLETLQERINALGRSLGPPWTQDEKLASLAAWIVLAESDGQ